MKINSIDKNVKQILESGYYQIPRFQRPYSWKRENVEEFWQDVIVDSEADYFIGSIVIYKEKEGIFCIVDGQQRLTTVTMVLCALRNALNNEGLTELARGIHRLVERADIDNKLRFILQTETSYPYLQEHIQKFGSPDIEIELGEEQQYLESSFTLIVEKISSTITSIKDDPTIKEDSKVKKIENKLISIRDKILVLKLIFIELDEEDDAYIIFETLNTRGKDLSVSDLVKNHLTKLLKPSSKGVDITKDKWNSLLETIETSSADINVDAFLHHFWLSKYDYVTAKKLFKQIKQKIKKNVAKDFLNDLLSDARTYREIHETSYSKWDKQELAIKDSLDALNLFRVKQQVPLVLSVMREYRDNRLNKKQVIDILTATEKFHFIFTAVTSSRSSGGISFMYAYHARNLLNANETFQKIRVLDELKGKYREKVPKKNEFMALFPMILYTDTYTKQKRIVQYILAKIDKYNSTGTPVDYQQMTIEHLLPQSQITSDLKTIPIAMIGNMILVDEKLNNKLSNKKFNQKKEILREAGIRLDPILDTTNTWDMKKIIKRTDYLAELAYDEVWNI